VWKLRWDDKVDGALRNPTEQRWKVTFKNNRITGVPLTDKGTVDRAWRFSGTVTEGAVTVISWVEDGPKGASHHFLGHLRKDGRIVGVYYTNGGESGDLELVLVPAQGQPKQVQARDLAGKYRAVCSNPDGTRGEGIVEIEWLEGNKVKFISTYDTRDVGSGTLKGDTLSVKYRGRGGKKDEPKRTGEAEYRVKANGVLEGWWHYGGDKKMPEKLTPLKKK
jgi:hypothetical protein